MTKFCLGDHGRSPSWAVPQRGRLWLACLGRVVVPAYIGQFPADINGLTGIHLSLQRRASYQTRKGRCSTLICC
ncbi:hypothetical protein CN205_04865, partial [Sinorhizobium meliloti]